MSQTNANAGFRYPSEVHIALEPWRSKLGADFDRVAALLLDRDRALEDHLASAVPGFEQILTEESTTSMTDTDLATVGPTVEVKLPRGRCIVTGGALVTSTATGQTAAASLFIDGVFNQDLVLLGNNSGGSLSASLSATFLFNDLDPGTHTFQIKYLSSNGVTVRFAARFLLVQPIV